MAEPPVIDVERIVDELRERLAAQRATGAYADDLSAIVLDVGAVGPQVRFRPELGFSSKPVVGPVITGVKQLQLRLLHYVLKDLADQTDAAIGRVEIQAVDALARARSAEEQAEQLAHRVAALEEALARVDRGTGAEPANPP